MIDTHTHVAERMDGLEFIVLSASNVQDSRENTTKASNSILPSVGIHPQETGLLDEIEELLEINKNIVAVGECGLDFSQECDKYEQERLFRGQIELAIKYNKPLIIHSRKAMDETIEILKQYDCRGVIHCYTGGIKRIKNVPENFCFGIDGNLTYEDGLIEVVRNIPKNRLLLETDSPFLTPLPHRGEPNCPQYVKYTYQKVADIWEMDFKQTEKIIDENAKKLFYKI